MSDPEYRDYGYDSWTESFYFYNCAGRQTDGEWYHNDHHGTPWDQHRVPIWELEEPEPQSGRVVRLIRGLGKNAMSKLAMVVAGPHPGVSMCVEGSITPAHIDRASQTISYTDDYVDVPDVRIGEYALLVRVVNGGTNGRGIHRLLVADTQGNPLNGQNEWLA